MATLGNGAYTKWKNRRKRVRTTIQIAGLLLAGGLVFWSWWHAPQYRPYTDTSARQHGFIALSYFGVQKTDGSQLLISEDNLRAHLTALKAQGYETITTDDIEAYYKGEKELPEKSLYLMFEDGRRDTAIFASPILEDLNYRATTFTYPEKFDRGDTKFLLPDDLKRLPERGFWDVGTNGYRLFFINVYDRYDNYLGEMDPLIFNAVSPYLGRRYNHYLMDYIRDKDGVPKESYDRMKQRIQYDYEKLNQVYMDDLGYVPKVSVLMHANTGEFGNNPQVSAINGYWLQKMFAMNFNREGYALNVPDSSVYDLTRMQPQAWWPVNHLLMRIQYDTHREMNFNTGEADKYDAWTVAKGAAECKDEKIFLTTLPNDNALMTLKGSEDHPDVTVQTTLDGNKAGTQRLYLRADSTRQRYLAVTIQDNTLSVTEAAQGTVQTLYSKSIDELEGKEPISTEEDKQRAEETELEAFARYAPSAHIGKTYADRLKEKTKETPRTVAEGAEAYVPVVQNRDKGSYPLEITVKGATLTLSFKGKEVASVPVSNTDNGAIALEAAWNEQGWQQRNLDDDVYDGVFTDLTVTDVPTGQVVYTSKYTGWEKVEYTLKQYAERVIDWFVHHL